MARRSKAERLTQGAIGLIYEIGKIRSLTEPQAYQIKVAIESAVREMHFHIQVANEPLREFSLSEEPSDAE